MSRHRNPVPRLSRMDALSLAACLRGHQVAFRMIIDDLRECGIDERLHADLLRQMRSFEHTSAELEKRILKILEDTHD